jgi:large subunit ribosomal protein L21
MLAIVEIGGKQYTVKAGDVIEVDNRNEEVGAKIVVSPLLLAKEDGSQVTVGTPSVEGGEVTFKVLENFRGDKVTVFKMKSKKRYSRTRGFRAQLTKLEVVKVA